MVDNKKSKKTKNQNKALEIKHIYSIIYAYRQYEHIKRAKQKGDNFNKRTN